MTKLSRRTFVMSSLAGAAALALPRARRSRAAAPGAARNVIVLFAAGGWDVTYALDPKPGLTTIDAPPGTLRTFENLDIWTNANRPNVTAFFERYAAVTAVVRGVYVRSIAHPECRKRMLTGTPSSSNPDLGAICAHELGRDLPLPYLVLGNNAFTGPLASSAGRVGSRNQLVALLDSDQRYPAAGGASSGFAPNAADEAAIRQWVQARAERERAVRGAAGYNRRRLDDFSSSLERGDRLRERAASFGNRGRNLDLASQMSLAADVLEEGVSRCATLDSRIGWDTHNDNTRQAGFHDTVFGALKGLIDDLASRSGSAAGSTLLDETTVVVMSEMSRTPKINGQNGKDHWPVTSAMVIGAGVRGGRAYGGTNNRLESRPVDLATGEVSGSGQTLQTDNLVAGVLEVAGVDASAWLPGVTPLRGICA